MAHADLEYLNSFGPKNTNDIDIYDSNRNHAKPSFTFSTFSGNDTIKNDGTATPIDMLVNTSPTITKKVYQWLCGQLPVIVGNFTTAQTVEVLQASSASRRIRYIQDNSLSEYKVQLRSGAGTLGTSSSRYSVNTEHTFRWEVTSSGWKLWIDNTLEIEASTGSDLRFGEGEFRLLTTGLASSQDLHFYKLVMSQSDNEQARPDTSPTFGGHDPDGDRVSEYGDDVTCDSADGTYTKWDDWATTTADDSTTTNCGVSGNNEKEISTMTNATVADLFGLTVRARGFPNVTAKTVQTFTVIRDASANEQEKENRNLGVNEWRVWAARGFALAPDGAAWTQAKLDAVGCGIRTVSSNGAADEWTALYAESCGIGNDPPPAAGVDRRRLMGQVV